jgi:acyl transferase domain-containing protein/NAD(P)-dependent dehydrogenase (short-subunit alcohol dehydrogenase family)
MSSDAKPHALSAVKLALAARRLRTEGGGVDLLQSEPIAVIGAGCRLPGSVNTLDDYWRALESGTDAIREIPAARWDINDYYDPNPRVPAKMSTRWAGLLDQVDLFDAEFFGIAPREAASMDPQQRLLLEVSWEALNDAGFPPEGLSGSSAGVFFAIYNSDYSRLLFRHVSQIDGHASSGTAHGIAAGRLSYLLDLRGPSMAIDTACSSSLVAVHLACQSLRTGECSLALAGGVNVIIAPEETIALSKWGMLAPDGRCKTFDATANGFVRGEGCGVIVLKRLADALADGDPIHGVIRGSAVNQDGRSTVLTAPNGLAQQAVLRQAYRNARVEPRQISYVEAHGTGTALGDPIEVEALAAVLGAARDDGSTCRLGSVKTNFGHLEAAAGIAGLIKVLLAMRHEKIPPHLHFSRLNPLISLERSCLVISGDAAPWPAGDTPRLAGVSSFGFGGTNAHVVLEEPPQLPASRQLAAPAGAWLLPLSAQNISALDQLAAGMEQHLRNPLTAVDMRVPDLCFTAAVRRWHFPVRAAFVGATPAELADRIRDYREARPRAAGAAAPGKLAFIFSGHGSQWLGMGRNLRDREPVFSAELEKCDAAVRAIAGWSVLEALDAPTEHSRLDDTEIFQPVLIALQAALAALWRSWGVVPDAVIGHSVGEIAAAYVSKAITLEVALNLAVLRGRLMQMAPPDGRMAAAEIAASDARELIARLGIELTVAAINAPQSITLSGAPEAIQTALTALAARGVSARQLNVSRAFHSVAVVSCAEQLRAELARSLRSGPSTIPFYSTVDGQLREGHSLDANYWARNIQQPVLFAAAVESAIQAGCSTFVELGPHPVLGASIHQCLATSSKPSLVLSCMRRGQDEQTTMLTALGALYTAGHEIAWRQVYRDGSRCVSLPAYPWQRERHWLDVSRQGDRAAETPAASAVGWPGRWMRSAFLAGRLLEAEIRATQLEFVDQHRICGIATVPAAAMIDLALGGARAQFGPHLSGQFVIKDLTIDRPLTLADDERRAIQAGCKPTGPDSGTFQLYSRPVHDTAADEHWTLHASAGLRLLAEAESLDEAATATLDDARQRCTTAIDRDAHYRRLADSGLGFGPRFRGVEQLWRGRAAGLARIQTTGDARIDRSAHIVDPSLLDACLQAITAAYPVDSAGSLQPPLYLPVALQSAHLSKSLEAARWSFARLRAPEGGGTEDLVADISIFADSGQCLGWLKGLHLHRTERAQLERMLRAEDGSLYELVWQPQVLTDRQSQIGRCLILSDRGGVGCQLAAALAADGTECITVMRADGFRPRATDDYQLAADNPVGFGLLLQHLRMQSRWPVEHVVHCWGLDVPAASEDAGSTGRLTRSQVLSCGSALHLLQALGVAGGGIAPRVWFLTRGAVSPFASTGDVAVTQSPLQGFARVAALEHPEFRCTTVDLSSDETRAPPIGAMVAELRGNDASENQLVLTDSQRFVARLRRIAATPESSESHRIPPANLALRPPESGVLEELSWAACPRHPPGADEVQIQVEYAGLNFRDVLTSLRIVPGASDQLGAECAGRVVAAGDNVRDLKVGDEVTAFAIGGLRSFVNVPARLAMPKPTELNLAQAAALPVIFLTALYALRRIASLRAGEKVLIHAAAGGVGCAAVQLARIAGAEIFATVSSAAKAALVKSWGAHHTLNSRTLAFADEIRSITGGAGVDVVLNSLTGEFASTSLGLVRSGGVFIELGKRDLLDAGSVAHAHPGVRYAAFDMAEIARHDPGLIRSLLEEMNKLLATRQLQLPPIEIFPASSTGEAFRHMALARHVGKIVISMEDARPIPVVRSALEKLPLGVYVISGGLGALGLQFAHWLAAHGASHIALLGRHEPGAPAAAVVEQLRDAGVTVQIYVVDVTDRLRLQSVLECIRNELGTVRGVLHTAGVLDDAMIDHLDWQRFESVLAAKVDGSWNLHALTRDDPLEFFVLFSSLASMLGWPGQASYAAANAFLDGLAHHRRARGLTAVSINWGPWAGVGMVADLNIRDRERLLSRGFEPMSTQQGLEAFERIMQNGTPQAAAALADWPRFIEHSPGHQAPPLLRDIARRTRGRPGNATADAAAGADFFAQLTALPLMQRWPHILAFVERHAARALGLAPGKTVDSQRPLRELGLDSLLSVELRNALAASLGRPLNATLLFDYPTVEALARHLAGEVLKCDVDVVARPEANRRENEFEKVRTLSDEEAEASLLRELERAPL